MAVWFEHDEISMFCADLRGGIVVDHVLIGRRVRNSSKQSGRLLASNAKIVVYRDVNRQGRSVRK